MTLQKCKVDENQQIDRKLFTSFTIDLFSELIYNLFAFFEAGNLLDLDEASIELLTSKFF